jgi:hypothetical protein
MQETREQFQEWAVVELMGHQRMAGLLTEATLAGGAFFRIDIPEHNGRPAFTRFLSPGAIYAINPVSEEIARGIAANCGFAPVNRYELPRLESGSPIEKDTPMDPDEDETDWDADEDETDWDADEDALR